MTPADGPSLGTRSGGHVDVDAAVQRLRVDAQLLGMRAHVGQRDLRGLLHDVAQLTGQLQTRLAVGGPGLDVEHISAQPRHRKPVATPGTAVRSSRFRHEPRTAQVANEFRLIDGQRNVIASFG